MRVVLQRISEGWVETESKTTCKNGPGLLALVGFHHTDERQVLEPIADKMCKLRIFEDDNGKMNRSLLDEEGSLLLVSQFTLYADLRRGRRPGFSDALEPVAARKLFQEFVSCCEARARRVITGEFGASMRVHLINAGPVTLVLDSRELFGEFPAAR